MYIGRCALVQAVVNSAPSWALEWVWHVPLLSSFVICTSSNLQCVLHVLLGDIRMDVGLYSS